MRLTAERGDRANVGAAISSTIPTLNTTFCQNNVLIIKYIVTDVNDHGSTVLASIRFGPGFCLLTGCRTILAGVFLGIVIVAVGFVFHDHAIDD